MKKTNIIKISLVILTLSLLATSVVIVQADPIGIGKYVNITVIEPQYGEVTLTKLSSGETWTTDNTELIKVGAGEVSIYAEPYTGYDFDYWLVDEEQIKDITYYFKTSKGVTEVKAHFKQKTYYITARPIGPGTINGTTFLEVPVENNEFSPTFIFTPDDSELYHISSIQVDTTYIGYSERYTFPEPITSNHTITVNFNDVGIADIPSAEDVTVFLDSIASLIFDGTDGGRAEGTELSVPEGSSIFLWNISTNAGDNDNSVTVAIQFDSSSFDPIAVYRAESADALYSDVNIDGVVDGTDVSLVAIGIKTTVESGAGYDPLLDIDRDGDLDQDDVLTVNENKGTELTLLTFTIDGNTIYIETDHFTLFRCR
jgi:hypothetical protein